MGEGKEGGGGGKGAVSVVCVFRVCRCRADASSQVPLQLHPRPEPSFKSLGPSFKAAIMDTPPPQPQLLQAQTPPILAINDKIEPPANKNNNIIQLDLQELSLPKPTTTVCVMMKKCNEIIQHGE